MKSSLSGSPSARIRTSKRVPELTEIGVRAVTTIVAIKALGAIGIIAMAADRLTTIPVRASTRSELQRLKSGGQSYDDVIRSILEELEERDPWFQEMERRLDYIHSGKLKLEPIESLYEKDRRARSQRTPR